MVILSYEPSVLLLGQELRNKVADAATIGDLLKRTEQSSRAGRQAPESLTLQVSNV